MTNDKYQIPVAPENLTDCELKVFNHIIERAKRYSKAEFYGHSFYGSGSKEELIKVGLIKPEWVPGVVGKTVSTQRVVFLNVQSEGELFHGRKIKLSGLEFLIKIDKWGNKYRIRETFPDPIYVKLRAQWQQQYESEKLKSNLNEAQQIEARHIASLPKTADEAKSKLLNLTECYLSGVDDLIRSGQGGFVIESEQRSHLLEQIRELALAIMNAKLQYKPELKTNAITKIKLKTARADLDFQAFIQQIATDGS